jgi:hypothetical protein
MERAMAGKKDIWSLMSGAVISLTFATSAMAEKPASPEQKPAQTSQEKKPGKAAKAALCNEASNARMPKKIRKKIEQKCATQNPVLE